jgi:hypothetical protein
MGLISWAWTNLAPPGAIAWFLPPWFRVRWNLTVVAEAMSYGHLPEDILV